MAGFGDQQEKQRNLVHFGVQNGANKDDLPAFARILFALILL
jgi:hypothetical protein